MLRRSFPLRLAVQHHQQQQQHRLFAPLVCGAFGFFVAVAQRRGRRGCSSWASVAQCAASSDALVVREPLSATLSNKLASEVANAEKGFAALVSTMPEHVQFVVQRVSEARQDQGQDNATSSIDNVVPRETATGAAAISASSGSDPSDSKRKLRLLEENIKLVALLHRYSMDARRATVDDTLVPVDYAMDVFAKTLQDPSSSHAKINIQFDEVLRQLDTARLKFEERRDSLTRWRNVWGGVCVTGAAVDTAVLCGAPVSTTALQTIAVAATTAMLGGAAGAIMCHEQAALYREPLRQLELRTAGIRMSLDPRVGTPSPALVTELLLPIGKPQK